MSHGNDAKKDGELDDSEIESVAGGAAGITPPSPTQYADEAPKEMPVLGGIIGGTTVGR